MTIYETRKQAKEAAYSDEVVVKVTGGYMIMGCEEYRIWRQQK